MTNWTTVFRFEFRQQFRRKSYLFVTFGLPLLALIAFFGYQLYDDMKTSKDESGSVSSTAEESVTSVIADDDGVQLALLDLTPDGLLPGPESYGEVNCDVSDEEIEALQVPESAAATRATLIKRVSSPACLKDTVRTVTSLDEGRDLLEEGTIDALFVAEEDFAQTGNLSSYIKGFNLDAMNTDSVATDYVLRSVLYDVPAEDYESLYLRLLEPAFIGVHQIQADGSAATTNESKNFTLIYVFGLTIIMSIFWGGGYLMQSVVQEKESRAVEILLSSVRPTALLVGKTLAMAAIALIQVAFWLAVIVLLLSQAGNMIDDLKGIEVTPTMLIVMAINFALGYLLFGSLMAAIGAFSTSVREAQNFVVLVTLPAMIPFFVLTVFQEEPNGTLATLLSMIPFTAPLSMVMRVVVTDVPLGQILLSSALLAVSVVGAIWLAGRLFRVHTLLSGTMPKWRDIPKLIFG